MENTVKRWIEGQKKDNRIEESAGERGTGKDRRKRGGKN
jgi:hypothetical protein